MIPRLTLSIPRRVAHSMADAPGCNPVSIAAPPFALEIDHHRRDTAPATAPIRNRLRGKRMGHAMPKREAEMGVMDFAGYAP